MKHVVIVGPNVGLGGVERASSNLANSLVALGCRVTYLALIPEEPFFELQRVDYREPVGFNTLHMNLPKTMKYIRNSILELKPDIIIAFTKFYAAVANLALLFSGHRVIVTERSSPLYVWPKRVEWFCKLSFKIRKPVGVISQTTIASEYHKKYYGTTNYVTIPNALRTIKYYPQLEPKKWFLAVGRFNDPCKGFDLLVQAFNNVRASDWQLIFAGGSYEEGKYLLDIAKDEPTRNRIKILGKVKEIDELYAQAGVFVMPSRLEGFPNALAEALAAGCCCVSFDFVAGPRDLIVNGVNGLLVPAERTDLLAIQLNNLTADQNFRCRLGQAAKSVGLQLDGNKIAQLHMDFLRHVCNPLMNA